MFFFALQVFPLVRNELNHWWQEMQSRMKHKNSANPYCVYFARDVPRVVFSSIVDIACTAMYGIALKKTPALTVLTITKDEKMKMVLNAMNQPTDVVVRHQDLLHRVFPSGAQAKIILNDEFPCIIRFNKNSERMTYSCKFGY